MSEPQTVYEAIGGAPTIRKLVNRFYANVARHPDLIPLFPRDLTEVRERQYMFLTQFFGGPMLYAENRGAPKLRMRHAPFPITPKHAKAWLSCMSDALNHLDISKEARDFMFERLTLTAHHMVNTAEEEG